MLKLFVLLGACFVALLGFFYSEDYRSGVSSSANDFEVRLSGKEYLLLTLSSELEEINANLPVQLDQNTILNSVSIDNETIVNHHTIVNVMESDLTPEVITRDLIPRLVRQVCSDETKKGFLDSGISISMDYFDADNALIFKFVVTRTDCAW